MSYYYYPPVFNMMPYFLEQYLQNSYYLHNTETQKQGNIVDFKSQQLNFPQDSNQKQDPPNEQSGQKSEGEKESSVKAEKKRKIKKRGVDKEKQLQSAKKNSESNIINQFFSYFSCRIQSEQIVEKAILLSVRNIDQQQKVVSIFYNIMKCMSLQRVKKYVNKKTLLHVFVKENIEKQIPEIIQKFQCVNFVTIEQICEVIRRCCLYFIRNTSLISVLASKRISVISKREHLKKRRMICNLISGKL